MKKETKDYLIGAFVNVYFIRVLITLFLFILIVRTNRIIGEELINHWFTWILISSFIVVYHLDLWHKFIKNYIQNYFQHSCTAKLNKRRIS